MNGLALIASEAERFRAGIARRLGLQFDDSRLGFLVDLLHKRIALTDCPSDVYLAANGPLMRGDEVRTLAPELTVGESYFLRHIEQFRALTDIALPDRIRGLSEHHLRILSAGCSAGEEPYSIAMQVQEFLPHLSRELSILGVDVNPLALEKARLGCYTQWSLRETPAAMQSRWFRADGRNVILDESLRRAVRFLEHNLVDDGEELWQADSYDVIFLRNVVMYMTRDCTRQLIARVTRALAPGGYLFLGHAETLRGLSNDFHLHHTHGTFYYQLKLPAREPAPRPRQASEPGSRPAAALDSVGATAPMANPVGATAPLADPAGATGTNGKRPWDLSLALELLQHERFDDALDLVLALPPDSDRDPDVLLLRAVLLTHSGRFERARATCLRLLERDELNAGAHYLLALCDESAGASREAVGHDRMASYLDPAFAMPHLHLGLVARRSGDLESARRELAQALPLIEREAGSRLLLFGGGFSRDALLALCRGGIVASGGKP